MPSRDLIPKSEVGPIQRLGQAEDALATIATEHDRTDRLATLGMLTASIAHEINNILTPVLAYAQMASARPGDHELAGKAIEKTIHGIETATRIADAILGFAGDDNSMIADVGEVLNAAMDCLAHYPNKTRLSTRVEVQQGTMVSMNPLCLQQVLMNLILNAQTAMCQAPAASRQCAENMLTIAAITRADGTVGIRITDTGPGIPNEVAGRLFEPFVTTKRAISGNNSSNTGRGEGRGLGLSICRRLIEQARGTITASSTPGRGSTFAIILPSPESRRAKAG